MGTFKRFKAKILQSLKKTARKKKKKPQNINKTKDYNLIGYNTQPKRLYNKTPQVTFKKR